MGAAQASQTMEDGTKEEKCGGAAHVMGGGAAQASQMSAKIDSSNNRLSMTITAVESKAKADSDTTREVTVGVSVKALSEGVRSPLDIVCVVDVSGSMATEVSVDKESHGLTVLDVTKHAVKTIISILGPQDRVGLVVYSTNARTVCGLTNMDPDGKKLMITALNKLHPGGQTNLWAGLKAGLNVMNSSRNVGGKPRVQTVLLLTDGQPNIAPPRGHVTTLKNYFDAHPKLVCTVSTFGFGYNLDSRLLVDLSNVGNGSYSFIPDCSLVGTVFVNTVSNLLSTIATDKEVVLSIEPIHQGTTINTILGPQKIVPTSWGSQVSLGTMTYGQSRDVVLKMTVPCSVKHSFVRTTIRLNGMESSAEGPVTCGASTTHEEQIQRLMFCSTLETATNLASSYDFNGARRVVKELVKQLENSLQCHPNNFVKALLEDANGQVTEAFSRSDWFQKWGVHYIPSLMRAHLLQQCNNFKDPGVQGYGGVLFAALRDEADEIFNTIPPPEPTYRRPNVQPLTSMAVYNCSSGGCFHGDCNVRMADGSLCLVKNIRKGDLVRVAPTAHTTGKAEIKCTVKIICDKGTEKLVRLPGSGLRLTPWHPVLGPDNKWTFPAALGCVKRVSCNAVYDFVLSNDHVMVIDDVHCVTLGHNFTDTVRRHNYFGSQQVVNDLRGMDGWHEGQVVLHSDTCMVRSEETSKVIRFCQKVMQ